MNSISVFSFFLVFSSFFYLGFSDGPASAECMQKLMPCKDSIKSVTAEAPEECCMPLEQVLESDPNCTCSFFNDLSTLKSLGVTSEQALKLPHACNLHFDDVVCKPDEQIPAGGPSSSPSKEGDAQPSASTEGATAPTADSPSTSPPSPNASSAPSTTSKGAGSGSPPVVTVTDAIAAGSPPQGSAEASAATKIIAHFGAAALIALLFAAY